MHSSVRRWHLILLGTLAIFAGTLSAPARTQSSALAQVLPTVSATGPVGRPLPHSAPAVRPQPLVFRLVEAAGANVRGWPGGPVIGTLPTTTPLGSHTWVWALSVTGHWARTVLPWRPNGRTGWIDLRGRGQIETPFWVQADVSRRTVTLMRGRARLRTFAAAVGTSVSPTPTGQFFVTDLVATGDASGPFGWYAFGLSGHQPNLPAGWGGGDQLAIHGTNDPSSIGTAASAGCLRVSASALGVLKHYLRLGTPVVIEP
jgi:lipoprotein-anchoring transpeptidase ErfK/SrfK